MAAVAAGNLLVNAVDPGVFTVYTDDSLLKKTVLSLPSALPADEVFGNQVADVAFQTAYAVVGVGLARQTTSRKGLLYTAAGAQAVACAGDALMEGVGLIKSEEHLKDVGWSTIFSLGTNKYLLDKRFEAKSKGEAAKSRMYLGALAVLDIGLTAGAYAIENGGAGLLAAGPHLVGIVAGAATHRFGGFRKKIEQERVEADFANLAAKYGAA